MRRKVIKVKPNAKSMIIIIITLGILFVLPTIVNSNLNFNTGNRDTSTDYLDCTNLYNDNLKNSEISGTITIDGNADWVEARNAGICTGYGFLLAPYVIEDLVINSEGSGTCLMIRNSNMYFRVENCTLYNSGGGFGFSGIKLQSVSNGILNNNTSYENNYGISVRSGYNINITGNVVKDNAIDGIYLQFSDDNNVSNNVITNNIYGIHLDRSDNNIIKNNGLINNDVGIILEGGRCNQILLNSYSGNAEDLRDNQGDCDPESPPYLPIISPFPIEIAIISMFFIVPAIVVGLLIVKRRSSKTESRKYEAYKKPVKQNLVVSDDIKNKMIKEAPQIEVIKGPEPEKPAILSSPEERISKERGDVEEIKVEDQEVLEPLGVITEPEKPIIKKAREETIGTLKPPLPAVEQSPYKSEPLKTLSKEPFSTPISSSKSAVEQTPLKEESSKRVTKETIPPEVKEEIEKPIPVEIELPQPKIFSCAFCGMEVDAERNFCQQCGHKLKKM